MMLRQGLSAIYAVTDTVITTIGGQLDYQYYIVKNGVEYREIYYNFYYTGTTTGEAERRIFEDVNAAEILIEDIIPSSTDPHRPPIFRNTQQLSQDVLVTFTCDLRPAYYQVLVGDTLFDIQGNLNVTDPDSVYAWGVAMNGPASGGWDAWGLGLMQTDDHRMYDDGTHGDAVAGDTIFTMQVQFLTTGDNNVVGQEFKFGVGGGDNEGGYGNNHIENIDDSQATYTIESQFGSIDPVFYDQWNFDTKTGVEKEESLPLTYELNQNYPNPFNPVTHIQYRIASAEKVTLTVYNLMGERVVTLVDKKQSAGAYEVTWDARDARGIPVSSGVYFYRIEAGDFTRTHKMLLMK
jgi:hypothetical protein